MSCCGRLKPRGLILPSGTEIGQFLESGLAPSSWILPLDALVGDVGQVLTVPAANEADFEALTLAATDAWHMAFGAQQVNTGTQAIFAFFSTSAATNPIASATVAIVPFAGVIKNLYVTHGTPTGADNLVYTVMKNGVATTLTKTLSSGAVGPVSDLVNTPAVAAGDRLTVRVTGAAANRACVPRIQFLLT